MDDNKDYQIQRLNSALEVSGRTIKSMEKKLARMQDLVTRMEHDKNNWQQIKVASEEIIRKQLEFADQEKAKLQDEIIELRRQIKELKAD
jgi:hypothetical protein